MKFAIVLLSSVTLAAAARLPRQTAPALPVPGGVDNGLIGGVVGSVAQVTTTLSSVQRALMDITQNFQRIVQTSTRLIGGNGPLPAHYQEVSPAQPDYGQTLVEALGVWTQNLRSVNNVLVDLSRQMNVIMAQSTRLVTGLAADEPTPAPASGPSATEAALAAFNQLTQQLTAAQRVLGELSSQLNRMVQTGSRLVAGQESGAPTSGGGLPALPGPVPSPAEAALQAFSSFATQLQVASRVLTELNTEFNRMVTTSTRFVSGQDAGQGSTGSSGPPPTPVENFLTTISRMTQQISGMQRVFGEMSSQVNRMITTGSRLVTGLEGETGQLPVPVPTAVNPGEAMIQAFSQFTTQMRAAQSVLSDLNKSFTRMVTTSSRLVTGLADESETSGPNPAAVALQAFSQFTNQLTAAQRVLSDLSSQFNRMIESSTRLVSGQQSESQSTTSGPNPTDAVLQALAQLTNQLQAMQRVLGDLSQQLNRMITTGSRLVSGQDAGQLPTGQLPTDSVPSPGESVLHAFGMLVSQLTGAQRVLNDLNAQLSTMIASSARLVSG